MSVLFQLTCVTCQAKLNVRNESAIGQILSCPRCGSMVQVARPADQDSEPTLAEAASPTMHADADEVADQAAAEFVLPADSDPSAATVTPDEPPIAPAEVALTDALANSANYQLIAWGIAGATALTIGLAVTYLLWESSPKDLTKNEIANGTAHDSTTEINSNDRATNPPSVAQTTKTKATDAGVAETPEQTTPVKPAATANSNNETSNLPLDGTATDSRPAHGSDTDTNANHTAAQTTSPPPAAVTNQPKSTSEPEKKLVINPLDLDPEGLDLSTLANLEKARAHPSLAASASARQPVVGVSSAEPSADESTERQPAQPPAAVRRDPLTAPTPSNAAERLATKLPNVTIEKMPLCEFLNFATQLSNVPVSVSSTQLRQAGISATKIVSISQQEGSLLELLTAVAKPLRLEPMLTRAGVQLQRTGDQQEREVEYPIEDLVSDRSSSRDLAQLVRQMVASPSWQNNEKLIEEDGNSLIIHQSPAVHYEILTLLERLRLARELPQLSKYPKALLSVRSSYAQLQPALARRTTFTFSQYTQLQEVFAYWQSQLGVALLIDWPSLASAQWHPQSRISCSITDKPWTTALDDVLTPLGLTWRAVDGRTLEITVPNAAQQRIEFYAFVPNHKMTISELERKFTVNTLQSYYDQASRTLIAKGNARNQKRLAEWLSLKGVLAAAPEQQQR